MGTQTGGRGAGVRWLATLILFVLAVALGGIGVSQWYEGRRDADVLTPSNLDATLATLGDKRLVDLEGFAFACDDAVFDGERLLVPGSGESPSSVVFLSVKHTSACRSLPTRFRGHLSRLPASVYRTALDDASVAAGLITPIDGGMGMLGLSLAFAALAGLFLWLNLRTNPTVSAQAEVEPDEQPRDPYRPGERMTLIHETVTVSPAFMARIRRNRTLQKGWAAIALVGALVYGVWGGVRFAERERIWADGVVALDATAEGKVTSHYFIVNSTELDVTFIDAQGRVTREALTAWSLFARIDDTIEPEVRYLVDHPDRFAVSWIHEQWWGSLLLWVLVFGTLTGIAVFSARSALKNSIPEQVHAVFDNPRETRMQLIMATEQRVNGEPCSTTYTFAVPHSDRVHTHIVPIKDPAPLFLDEDHSVALALYNPNAPEYFLVLSETLRELHEPPFTAAQLRGRYRMLPANEDA